MKVSGDLNETANFGYRLNFSALNTIRNFDLEDERHNDNKKSHSRIFWLTMMIMLVGEVQSIAAFYANWIK